MTLAMSGRHRDFLPISLGTFALVAGYALANDQWIAAIAPQHFTLYQPAYFPFTQSWALALGFGLATGALGLAWGILLYWAGHYGPGPVVGRRATLLGVAVVLVATALIAWGLGWRTARTGLPFYPEYFYPSTDDKLFVSQTVQMTNFIAGLGGAMLWLMAISSWRTLKKPSEKSAQ